jgi:hypothetical protein
MKYFYFLSLLILLLSCNEDTILRQEKQPDIVVEKKNDTIFVKYSEKETEKFIMDNDSSYYDEDGNLFMSTRKDTVIYEDGPLLVLPIIKVIRKEDNDTYRTSLYILDRQGLPRPRHQLVYNKNYDILATKKYISRYTIQK